MLKVKIQRLNTNTDLPKYATSGSACLDLSAAIEESYELKPGERLLVPSGIAIEIPEGYEAQVRPRSGLALRNGITVLNTPGTIDHDYRCEIKVILINHGKESYTIEPQARIAQMIISPVLHIGWEEVEEISTDTVRGCGGFGSTGV